ncbi:MAG: TetR/AcrR family transcriptional regulator [Pseudomonadota bacterium]|nr:TetR/AcrR family transcriptional regulator [Pseudomonadota bacterium]
MDQPDKLPRRERERLRHRQEILDAARKILAVRGIDGITVEQVAREAEFAVGSIYRHFRSKEELIEVLISELAVPLFEELEALPASGLPFEEMLAEFVRTVHDTHIENLPVVRAFLAAPGNLPAIDGEFGERMRTFWQRYFAAFDALLRVGQEAGILTPGDRLPLTLALAGLLESFNKWALLVPNSTIPDAPALICRIFLDGSRARGASR